MKDRVKARFKRYAIEGLKLLLIVIVMANLLSYLRAPEVKERAMPALRVSTVDGVALNTEHYTGRPLLLHFWATWCPTCEAEADNIDWIAKHYDVLTVAVNSGNDAAITAYMKKHGLAFDVVNDRYGLHERFNVHVFPTTFIYDSKGELVFSEVGYTSRVGLWLRMWWCE